MKLKKYFALIIAVVLSVTMFASCGSGNKSIKRITKNNESNQVITELSANNKKVSELPTQIGINDDTSEKYLINYEEVARSSQYILYADMKKGHFALQDIDTEQIWYSTPNDSELDEITKGTTKQEVRSQLILYYVLKSEESTASFYRLENSQASCVAQDGITVEKITNGIRVTYNFSKSEIIVPVEYTLLEDGFSAKIDADKINEGKTSYLIGINLLPNFGAANWKTDGYMFVPDGSGALIPFNNHKSMGTTYKFDLYGSEKALMAGSDMKTLNKQDFHIPVFGTCKSTGSLMGIITDGDTSASINAIYGCEINGYNAVSSSMMYRSIDSKTMFSGQAGIARTLYRVSKQHYSNSAYEVVYHILDNKKTGYVAMAEKYRSYLSEKKLLNKNKKIAPSFNLELYGAADVSSSFLGINYSKTVELTTFKNAKKIIEALDGKGIKNINLRYIGWMGDSILNKKLSTSAKPNGKLGGSGEFKNLKDYMESIFADLYPDVDLMTFRKNGNGISVSGNSIKSMFNYPAEEYIYSKSVYNRLGNEDSVYYLNSSSVLEKTEEFLKNYSKNEFNNISLSNLGNSVYSDFSKSKGEYKDLAAKGFDQALNIASQKSESTAVETANAYAFKYADKIWNTPISSSGYDIYKTDVPFYQIVLHGYVSMTTPQIMQSQDPMVVFLKAVESGIELNFDGTYSKTTELIGSRYENLYSTCYTNWIKTAAQMNSRYYPLLKLICKSTITDHYEAKSGLFVTKYDNGIKTAVNYNSNDLNFDGVIVKGLDFAVLEGENK